MRILALGLAVGGLWLGGCSVAQTLPKPEQPFGEIESEERGIVAAMYDQAIELQPEGAWGYMGKAALLDVTGQYDDAVDQMIDGWERDQNQLTRLNMHFYMDEWAWQRDALIAEIEGDTAILHPKPARCARLLTWKRPVSTKPRSIRRLPARSRLYPYADATASPMATPAKRSIMAAY